MQCLCQGSFHRESRRGLPTVFTLRFGSKFNQVFCTVGLSMMVLGTQSSFFLQTTCISSLNLAVCMQTKIEILQPFRYDLPAAIWAKFGEYAIWSNKHSLGILSPESFTDAVAHAIVPSVCDLCKLLQYQFNFLHERSSENFKKGIRFEFTVNTYSDLSILQ